MRVKLLPLAISAAVAMPAVALADGPKVYGKMNVTMEMQDYTNENGDNDFDNWELNSNASRLGVKGSEKISDGLEGFYQAEYQISVDGDSDPFGQRDIYVGLKGGWGALRVGKFDSALKKAQGKIDKFGDLRTGDIGNVIVGEERVNDTLEYQSPKLADAITLKVGFHPGEDACQEGAADNCDDGPADTYSLSAVYQDDTFYAALAYDDGVVVDWPTSVSAVAGEDGVFENGTDSGSETMRLVLIGKFGQFDAGFLYQTAEESDADDAIEQNGYILSAGFKIDDKSSVYGQYGFSETDVPDVADHTVEITQFALGYAHKLSKQTKLFTNYIMLTAEDDAGTGVENESARLQFGVEHKF